MTYSMSLVDTLSGADKAAATTAVMVLVNAAAAAFDDRGPSPEKIVLLDLIRSEIEKWAANFLQDRFDSYVTIEQDDDLVAARVLAKLDERIDSKLEHFAENELDGRIDDWSANFLQDRFNEHVTISADDFDLDDKVLEIVQDFSFDVTVNR